MSNHKQLSKLGIKMSIDTQISYCNSEQLSRLGIKVSDDTQLPLSPNAWRKPRSLEEKSKATKHLENWNYEISEAKIVSNDRLILSFTDSNDKETEYDYRIFRNEYGYYINDPESEIYDTLEELDASTNVLSNHGICYVSEYY